MDYFMVFIWDWRIKKQKISQNVVYSKNCISLTLLVQDLFVHNRIRNVNIIF